MINTSPNISFSGNNRNKFGQKAMQAGKDTLNKFKDIKLPEDFPAELYVFPIISGYQSYKSYQRAPEENKKNKLKLNLFVLAGTSLGIFGGYKAFGKIFKKAEGIKDIKKDLLQTAGAPLGGVIAGFASGYVGSKLFPMKYVPPKKEEETKTSEEMVKEVIKDRKKEKIRNQLKQGGIFLLTLGGALAGNKAARLVLNSPFGKKQKFSNFAEKAINATSVLTGTAIGLWAGDNILGSKKIKLNDKKAQKSMDFILNEASPSLGAFNAGRQVSLKDRVRSSFYEIVSAVIVPSALILPTTHIVRNNLAKGGVFDKFLKKLEKISPNETTKQFICEKTITVPLTIGAYILGNSLGDLFNQKITKKILEQKFWDDFEKIKQDAIKDSIEGITENDKQKTQIALKKLQKVREIEEIAKENFNSDTKNINELPDAKTLEEVSEQAAQTNYSSKMKIKLPERFNTSKSQSN